MRILVYSHSYLPRVGGVEMYTDRLARYLVGAGVEAVVVTRTPGPEAEDLGRGYRVVRAPEGRDTDRLVAESDVLHGNGFHLEPFRAARRHRVPLLWFHHDYDVICPKSIAWNGRVSCRFSPIPCVRCLSRDHTAPAVARRLAAYAVKRACLGWAQVHAVHTRYAMERMGLKEAAVLRCGADLAGGHGDAGTRGRGERSPGLRTQDSSALSTQHSALSTNHSSLLFAGRLIPEKGCEVLLRALAICRDRRVHASLEVCGDGPERAHLEQRVRELDLEGRVRFRGNVSQAELPALMRGSLATVVPSIWDEVTGAVALEAMGEGCPVIASEVGGLGEMVRGVGLLFDRGHAEQLAARIMAVAEDPVLASDLARRCAESAGRVYNWDLVIGEYLRVYREMARAQ